MALITEEQLRRAATRALARVLRDCVRHNRILLRESLWVSDWLDRSGAEPSNRRAFVRSVVARARRAVPQAGMLCTGYGPDP